LIQIPEGDLPHSLIQPDRICPSRPQKQCSWSTQPQYHVGIDVSLEQSSVCVVDAAGKIVREAKVATDPRVLVSFETRVRELVANHPMLQRVTGSMLLARATLQREHNLLHKALLKIVRRNEVCRQFMTAPGVGPIAAITYKTAIDDPYRIKKSKGAGPLFGLTPKRYQSGETDVIGGISRIGDAMVRATLYEAANVLLSRTTRFSALKRWGLAIAKRRGMKRAKVAVARKIAVILHRMWIDGTSFRWSNRRRPLRMPDLQTRRRFMARRLSRGPRIRCQSLRLRRPLRALEIDSLRGPSGRPIMPRS
jgi:hypothetical protein